MKIDHIHNITLHYKKSAGYRVMIVMAVFMLIFLGMKCEAAETPTPQDIVVDTTIFMRQVRELQELIVNPKKEKYSKKKNPAVQIIENVRKNRAKGDPRLKDKYSFDRYDKTTLGLLDFPEEQLNKHSFLKDYMDTTTYGNRPVLNVFLKERGSTLLYSGGSTDPKTVIYGQNSSGIGEMFDEDNIGIVLDDFMREIDVYENDITLMSNKFPSPLSAIGPDYYKYYISDTLDIDDTRCIQLTFTPRNPESFSFSGNLYIELGDTTGFIKKISMKVPRTVNLNYIDNLYIDQYFEKDSLGLRHKVTDELSLDICLVKGTQRLYGHRKSDYSNFSLAKRMDLVEAYSMTGSEIIVGDALTNVNNKVGQMRKESLTDAESNMDTFMPRLREIPFFYWAEKVLVILVEGYIKTGRPSKFDIGPVNTLISTNAVEGIRLRLGGMTTANLSPHWFARGYAAYGTKDRKWKYKGELEYSFIPKKYHSREFPVNSLRATYMYDVDMIGQHYLFTNADNVFLSWKRLSDRLMTYRRLAKMEYNLELLNNLSFSVWGEHVSQEATPWLPFTNALGQSFSKYGRTSLGFKVRYAPGEKLLQDKSSRFRINREAPVIELSQEWGCRAFPGSDFALCKTELSVDKRFWFSAFGYLDVILKGGALWSQVPYTDLLWPNANLSYTIQPESYTLMNPMEFAIDRYASIDMTYWGNGVLFNRIPLIKKLRLREVVGFKGLSGTLSKRNNPALHPELYRFPSDSDVRLLGKTPYMEISAGIDNILTILRVEYAWRLSYRDTPGADKSGLRIALHFNF